MSGFLPGLRKKQYGYILKSGISSDIFRSNLFGLVEFASLRNSPEMWADKIMSMLVNFSRKDTTDEMTLNGYNTKEQESSLVNIYSILQSRNDME